MSNEKMVVELTVISSLPLPESGVSICKYIPKKVYQKKMFNTDNISLEQCMTPKGKIIKSGSIIKFENEYYRIKESYDDLKSKYFNRLEILGLNAKRSNYTNI